MSSNTDPATFVHAAKTWLDEAYKAGRWDEHSKLKGGMVTGLEEPFSRSSIMTSLMESHSQAIAEAVEAQEAKTLQDVIDWCNQMSRREELDSTTLRAVQIGCEKALSSLRNPQPLKENQ